MGNFTFYLQTAEVQFPAPVTVAELRRGSCSEPLNVGLRRLLPILGQGSGERGQRSPARRASEVRGAAPP